MKLIDLLDQIDNIDNDFSVCVYNDTYLNQNSEAISIQSHFIIGPEISTGLKYLIDVELAKEIIVVWSLWRQGKKPSPFEKYQAIIFYLENDAYLPQSNAIEQY